ncbi:cation acetate symporter [Vibrio parahaemolyticus]|uniref:sodium:solute symporter family protein n=1 Tax=Vibrio parahaemolyticus TaxID=670 RepID=UPI001376F663|nr:sodium:solute symporter family protein [Vibrio parahaemolyticus]NCG73824.1 cation acetate symporter [Vibrio parahaemolyticus]HCH4519613.1 cation acetate symporter [Vibrio parahaemolyticus]
MDLKTITYLVVGATFVLYIGIAIWARAGSTKEFYVAGGGVNPIANGMATAADWMSAASFISMAGLIAFMGYGGSVFLMGWTGGYVLLALLLAPYLRKFGKFTVPEFVGERFYSKTARIVAVVCLIIASVTYVIGQMKGVGVAFGRFLEVDYSTGLLIGMCIVFMYAVLGGMKGITYTQIAQYCVLILAYTIPAIFISLQLTGNPIPQIGLGSTMAGTDVYLLDRLDQVVTELGFSEYTTQVRGDTLNMFVYTMSLMIGTAGLPHVIIRFFTVPKVRDARTSAGWALVFIAILYTTAPAVSAMARLNLMDTVNPAPGQHLAYDERPTWFKNWEKTGLLGFDDKNGDGNINYTSDAATNELKVDNDIMVLANPEIAKLPNWVIALVAAGLLLAISSAISHDLIKGVINPNISEKKELLASRISMAVAIAVAGYLGLHPPGFAAGTVALAFGLAASSIFPALMMGIFSKNINKEGAIAGMIAGISITLFYVFQHKGILFIADWTYLESWGSNWFLGIEPNAFGAIGALFNFIVAFAVSKVTAETPQEVKDLVEHVRVPVGAGSAVDH